MLVPILTPKNNQINIIASLLHCGAQRLRQICSYDTLRVPEEPNYMFSEQKQTCANKIVPAQPALRGAVYSETACLFSTENDLSWISPDQQLDDYSKMATLKKTKNWFQDQLLLNADQKHCRMLQGEHSAILSTFIKLPFVTKIFVLSIFEWPLKTGFTACKFTKFSS